MRPLLLATAVLGTVLSAPVFAQLDAPRPVQELEPDAPPAPARRPEQVEVPVPERVEPEAVPASAPPLGQPSQDAFEDEFGAPAPRPRKASPQKPLAPPKAESSRSKAAPPPLTPPTATDPDIDAAWTAWRNAASVKDAQAAAEALEKVVALKQELGIGDLEAYAVGLLRAAEERRKASDAAGAVQLASAAVRLAPSLPHAHWGLARAYFFADATELGRFFKAAGAAVSHWARDPRYSRPVVADVSAAFLFAWMATAVAVVGLMFLRRARYFFHDLHHLFPKGAARWQSAAMGGLLLSLPFVFRLGVAPALLVFLAAVTLYLSGTERIVAAVLVGSLGLSPLVSSALVGWADFAGTPGEDVYMVERGGRAAVDAAERISARAKAQKATYAELFALGRYLYRRGQNDQAIGHLKAAASQRAAEPRVLTNLGNALFLKGDLAGAFEMYRAAMEAGPDLAAPVYNVAKLRHRRAAGMADDAAALERMEADGALRQSLLLDPSLAQWEEAAKESLVANRVLVAVPLPTHEVLDVSGQSERGDAIQAQLAQTLLGDLDPPFRFLYPVALALLLVGLGQLARAAAVSRACNKCGRPVCCRCDPELSASSELCNQCVHVFARRGAVPAAVKVRKQIEVSRYKDRGDKVAYALGLVCSGAGHLFSGLPIRGSVYAFLFLFVLFNLFFRQGVLRAPYGDLPLGVRLVPLGIALVAVYLLSLRGLSRRQAR